MNGLKERKMDRYKQIKTRKHYDMLLASGMFWEFHPELTGVWSEDRLLIQAEDVKKYNVIYADPPWDVKKIKRKSRPNQVAMDYPTMKLEDICNLPVSGMTKNNAVLFLWTTHAYLPKAFEVMSAWGFKYQRTITWDKRNGMCLFGFHHRTEFLLFGYKGKIDMYPKRKAFPTMVEAKSEFHSQKPQVFRDLIEPFGQDKLEMFARIKPDGWDVFGNEVEDSIDLSEYYT
jgi:N6-adenosine-specific RNA methylase IME4